MITAVLKPPIWTVEEIREKITNPKNADWLLRGLLAIWRYQTGREQATQQTKDSNGVGFNAYDAEFLSSMAEKVSCNERLSLYEIRCVRRAMRKYAGQLARIANQQQ